MILVALGGWMLAGQSVQAFDAESVHQQHCVACHARITGGDGHLLYGRQDGLVANASQLRDRIDHCQRGAGLDWTAEQVRMMQEYLSRRYYRFDQNE